MLRQLIVLLTFVATPVIAGPLTISGSTPEGPLTLTAYDYTAGAVYSVKYRGVEWIEGHDHGRGCQAAANYDIDTLGAEVDNPTEAGSAADGLTPRPSSSVRLSGIALGATMRTATQMAYWLPRRDLIVSDTKMRKTVTVGAVGQPRVVEWQMSITPNQVRGQMQWEALTCYHPAGAIFYTFDPATGELAPLSDGPGEQTLPIITATPDGQFAVGVYAPGLPQQFTPADPPGWGAGGYGRWRFTSTQCRTAAGATGCTKWNVVFRYRNVPAGETKSETIYTAFGTLEQAKADLRSLYAKTID